MENFIGDNLEGLYLLEEAYTSSRYLSREYDMNIAAKLLKFSEKALEVFKCLECEYLKIRREYLDNVENYLKKIKDVCKRFDSNCRLNGIRRLCTK